MLTNMILKKEKENISPQNKRCQYEVPVKVNRWCDKVAIIESI